MNDCAKPKIAEKKAELRKVAQSARARVHADLAVEGRGLLARRTFELIEQCDLDAGAIIAGYHPIRDELDCLGLLIELGGRKFKTALPKMRANENLLDFYEWDVDTPLDAGAYGVMEPVGEGPVLIPQLVLLPLLAFDLTGGRLGYGGGFYDRTLMALRGQGTVIAVGAGYDEQEFDVVPRESNDQLLDYIATPTRLLKIQDCLL